MSSPIRRFLDVYKAECTTTHKVMKAYPADKPDFKPHERSGTAMQLMHTFGIEQNVAAAAVDGTLKMPPTFPPAPPTIGEAIAAFDKGRAALEQALGKVKDARLEEMAPFFTGPGKMGDVPVGSILWLMLMDQVHHRGQLSVYIRMAGGKVPSIYGPSADEPWF